MHIYFSWVFSSSSTNRHRTSLKKKIPLDVQHSMIFQQRTHTFSIMTALNLDFPFLSSPHPPQIFTIWTLTHTHTHICEHEGGDSRPTMSKTCKHLFPSISCSLADAFPLVSLQQSVTIHALLLNNSLTRQVSLWLSLIFKVRDLNKPPTPCIKLVSL